MKRRVCYQFMLPVHVEVEDDVVTEVVVLDEARVGALWTGTASICEKQSLRRSTGNHGRHGNLAFNRTVSG